MKEKEKTEALFINLIMMFHSLAWQQLGKIKDPASGAIQQNLDAARTVIDTLEMLQTKTEGQRTPGENRILSDVLKELRLNYVDEVAKKRDRAKEGDSERPSMEGDTQS